MAVPDGLRIFILADFLCFLLLLHQISIMNSFLKINTPFILMVLMACSLLSAKGTGCHRKSDKNTVVAPQVPQAPPLQLRPIGFLFEKLRRSALPDAHTLSASANVFIDQNGQRVNANANLIWVRDSALWVNVKKLGIEAARALITKDSVWVINRLEKTWSVRSIESLQQQYGLPGGFAALQQTLLGGAWYIPGMQVRSDTTRGFHRVIGDNGVFGLDYRLEDGSFLLRRESFLHKNDHQNAVFSFENYKDLPNAGLFSYLRRIETASPKEGEMNLEIELNDVEINVPKILRFEIPEHYERVR